MRRRSGARIQAHAVDSLDMMQYFMFIQHCRTLTGLFCTVDNDLIHFKCMTRLLTTVVLDIVAL